MIHCGLSVKHCGAVDFSMSREGRPAPMLTTSMALADPADNCKIPSDYIPFYLLFLPNVALRFANDYQRGERAAEQRHRWTRFGHWGVADVIEPKRSVARTRISIADSEACQVTASGDSQTHSAPPFAARVLDCPL